MTVVGDRLRSAVRSMIRDRVIGTCREPLQPGG
jgi:hypothetical protein